MNLTPEIIDEEGKGILFARVASKLLGESKVEQATLLSEVGIKKHPNYAQGHFILAKCYQEKDMYEEARAEYERVLRYDANHLGAMKQLAGLYNSIGLNDVYKDYLFRLLTLDPLNSAILEECKSEGVYDIWKPKGEKAFSVQDQVYDEKSDGTDLNFDEEEAKSFEQETEIEKKETEDLLKIDLTQFENQNDDFTTIMDGLIQESREDEKEVDAANYLEDLESSEEIEKELIAEEKPIEESIDELDAFDNEAFDNNSDSTYLELDYSQEKEEKEDKQQSEEPALHLDDEKDKQPEEVELAFEQPKQRVEDFEIKEDMPQNNVHEKTELIFEQHKTNFEVQFDEKEQKQREHEEAALRLDSEIIPNKEEEKKEESQLKWESEPEPELKEEINEEVGNEPEGDLNSETGEDKTSETKSVPETEEQEEIESDDKSPYMKQKIVSQTLGEILVSQNKYKEAKQVFLALKEQQPDNPNIDKKLEILDKIIALDENKE